MGSLRRKLWLHGDGKRPASRSEKCPCWLHRTNGTILPDRFVNRRRRLRGIGPRLGKDLSRFCNERRAS
jgi:hypothetical protein